MKHYTVVLRYDGAYYAFNVWAADDHAAKRTAKLHLMGATLG